MASSVPPRARIRFWGTRGTCPSPGPRTVRYGGNTPCVELRAHDGEIVILDAGSGIRALGAHLLASAYSGPLHLFLTHRHSDHVLGLAHFAPLFNGQRLNICCGDGEAVSLEQFAATILSPPMFPYVAGVTTRLDIKEWDDCQSPRAGEISVHRFVARHPGEAAIFRLDDAHGALLAYAPDNELAYHNTAESIQQWRRQLADFLRDVPILVHDATYRHEELPNHVGWGHSSNIEAARFAMECGARTLVLFHHHPDRDDETVERMLDECREFVSREGGTVRLLAAWEGLSLGVA
jgi:phosphoribosyl 1,2-cyclic phosphodiesterase